MMLRQIVISVDAAPPVDIEKHHVQEHITEMLLKLGRQRAT